MSVVIELLLSLLADRIFGHRIWRWVIGIGFTVLAALVFGFLSYATLVVAVVMAICVAAGIGNEKYGWTAHRNRHAPR